MRRSKFVKGGKVFYRVNKLRRCLICNSPTGCFYTEDESLSYCCRRTEEFAGSARRVRITATGLGVYSHEGARWLHAMKLIKDYPQPQKKEEDFTDEAPAIDPAIISAAYNILISISPATNFPELIAADDGLNARCLSEVSDMYGALPGSLDRRIELVDQISARLQTIFPQRDPSRMVAGIPGFWFDKHRGKWMIGPLQEYKGARLLVPFRNPDGEILAIQIRTNKHERLQNPELPHYFWLSSPNYPEGARVPRAPIHSTHFLAQRLGYETQQGTALLLTEGALKADTVTCISQGRLRAIANSGVGVSHSELVSAAVEFQREYNGPVYLAFDMDAKENRMVALSIARLIASLALAAIEPVILGWDHGKGIDDALIGHGNIYTLQVDEWFKQLPEDLAKQAVEHYSQTVDLHRQAEASLEKVEDSISTVELDLVEEQDLQKLKVKELDKLH